MIGFWEDLKHYKCLRNDLSAGKMSSLDLLGLWQFGNIGFRVFGVRN